MSRNKELWEAVAYNKAAEVMKQLAGGADPNWPNDGAGGSTGTGGQCYYRWAEVTITSCW